jgi:PAB-dependent poly(A)-specific ribonuclease subunit 2
MPANEFELVNSVVGDGIQKDKDIGITHVAFDTYEELLWMGTKSGHVSLNKLLGAVVCLFSDLSISMSIFFQVTSYYGTHMQKYTSFQVHPTDEVRNVITMEHGILALTPTGLRSQLRRGIPCFTHTSDNLTDMHSMLINGRTGRVVLGGLQEKLIDFDAGTSKQFSVISDVKDGTNAILRDHGRFVVSGDVPSGRVHLRDPLTLKVAHTLQAHSGVLSDLDIHGHHLVTCGSHSAGRAPDRFLMVYDLRILKAISPMQLMVVPYQLRFLPSMSSRIVVLSSLGQVQLVDTAALSTPQMNVFQVQNTMEGCSTVSMDISPSNQCLAFGDTANSLHLYSSVAEPVFNPYARDSEFADPVEQFPPMDINDELAIYSSVPRPHLPPGQTSYCSDFWPERFSRLAYRPTPEVEPEILKSMKVVGSIGYARNITNMKRNVVRYPNVKSRNDVGNTNVRGGAAGVSGEDDLDGANTGSSSSDKAMSVIPKHYRKVAVKLSKMGTDDFDFDRYNRTGFCGLEASLPNTYCNAMLQIMYFSEKLRIILLNHTCSRENCICCELSFVFHMMDISPGMPCQSSNFLRALRTIPEASALGLVFTDQTAVWKCNVPRLVQSWNRFILQQVHMQSTTTVRAPPSGSWIGRSTSSPTKAAPKANTVNAEDMGREISAALDQPRQAGYAEDQDEEVTSLFSKLFGMVQEKVNICSRCKERKTKNDTVLLCNIIYPETSGTKEDQKTTFEDIVYSSMCPEQTTPAWCEQCRKYMTTTQTRNLVTLPNILSLNAGMVCSQFVQGSAV